MITRTRTTIGLTALALVLGLFGPTPALAQTVIRGPYLQMPSPMSMVIRWRTDIATDSQVNYGPSVGSLGSSVSDGASVTEHEIEITGLAPDTQYFYSVGTTGGELAGNDADHHFRTTPSTGTVTPLRFWAIGDSGYPVACSGFAIVCDAAGVRDQYLGFTGADETDLFFLLGDNAYPSGTDDQYQDAFFDFHEDFIRRVPVIPTFGNHEAVASNSTLETGPWFDQFSNPTAGESGGLMSGSESYYSLDFANVHIVVLDSQHGPHTAMNDWLEADLMGATADWIIAFWHHPPYSRGLLHNSDIEQREIDMREQIVPILEENGVDIVLSGHSHNYERSMFLDGHHGFAASLAAHMILDSGDGDPASDGAYRKASTGAAPNEGSVYVVSGSAAEVRDFTVLDHPAHKVGLLEAGSTVIDIDGDTLIGRFLNNAGVVTDYFEIHKGVPACPATPRGGCNAGARAKVVIKKNAEDAKNRFVWKWKQGDFDALDLGDPSDETSLGVCAYDATGNLLGGALSTGGSPRNSSWLTKPTGFVYKDGTTSFAGILKMRLKPGDASSSKFVIKGKGENLGLGTLPATLPLTVQLANIDDDACWESTFTTAIRNEAAKVVAKVAP